MKPEQIASIAHLARLSMDEAEIPRYQESLASILSFVGDLERAKVTKGETVATASSSRIKSDELRAEKRKRKEEFGDPSK